MVKNRRGGPKIFIYARGANLGDFPAKKQIRGFFSKMFWSFFRPISGLLKLIFVIWVGNPVFTVLVLFNEKYREYTKR
jgi:hypothetical protein